MIAETGSTARENPKKVFINVILVYLLLFVSGSARYNLSKNNYLILIFFIALVAWYLFTNRQISDRFLLYCVVFAGLLFSLSLYTGGSLSLWTVISMTMKLVLAYLIIRTVGANFTDVYIKVVVFLAAFSLLGYMSDIFQLFDGVVTKLPRVGNVGYDGIFYLYRYIRHEDRNHSIFFEPGAYQGFLNAALFLIVFTKTRLESRRKLVYIAVLLAALITAVSTTGFLIFTVLFALFLVRSEMLSFSRKVISVGTISVLLIVFAAHFHERIVIKLENYFNPSEERAGWSAENRSFDAQTDFKIFKKHVFGLGHDKYREEFGLIGKVDVDKGTSSNGVTSTFANYGLPYALFIFVSYYWALRKLLNDSLLATAAYIMFMMFLWGESYYQLAPISFSIITAAFIVDRFSASDKLKRVGESARQG